MTRMVALALASLMCVSVPVAAEEMPPADDFIESTNLAAGLMAFDKFQYDTAAKILKPLADEGHAEAQYRVAYMYYLGQGLPESPELTFTYALKADAQGHMGARLLLAEAYIQGNWIDQNVDRGIELLRSVTTAQTSTSEDIAEAHQTLAAAHEEGIGVKKSPKKAVEHYKLSYNAYADEFTLSYLIRLLDTGHGGSFEQEVDWYRKLAAYGDKSAFTKIKAHADAGDAHSQYVVGNVYFGDQTYGIRNRTNIGDIQANGQLNWEYWERAAKGGIGDAAVEATAAFQRGFPDAERFAKAAHWIKKAPMMDFLDEKMRDRAHINLGDAYFKGMVNLKILRDLDKAEQHYRAAKFGDGLNEVAKVYLDEKYEATDLPKGVALLKECAELQSFKCQFNLGVSYVYGKGIERSYEKALAMLDRSHANGFQRAKTFADELRRLGNLPDVKPDQLQSR
ncbi:SEL1-like repeat protein [Pontixanthobacter sp. CEM42]|uniref:tetratricopeptide repeat protein n=1 Tax=Pontixanthobacter sp. CEM42 TaxID=2792077 RepID=UPI001AE0E62F|nr:SEL1-like repeat protein [Pontixanthobacter sp. CEM42]